MEFRQLNAFIYVAQFQSFSKAAEYLGYSQSAVTVQVRLLEQELGARRKTLSPVMESSDTAFLISMLEQLEGISFLPCFAVEAHIRSGRLCRLDVTDTNIFMSRQIFYHKSKFKTREMDLFIHLASSEEPYALP